MKQTSERQVEVLTFQDREHGSGRVATIVTDGQNHRTYEYECCRAHGTLRAALAYLEVRGYRIVMDNFNWAM